MGCNGSCSSCSSGDQEGQERLPPGILKEYNLNQSTSDGTLVWVRFQDSVPSGTALDIIAEVKRICEGRVFAVVFGGPEIKEHYPRIFGAGADTIYHVRDKRLEQYVPEAYAQCLCDISERVNPAIVLFEADPYGREVAPCMAAMMGTGLTADCTGLECDGRTLTMIRPAFSGNIMANIICYRFPQIATVRKGVFPHEDRRDGTGTAIYWQYTGDVDKRIVSEKKKDVESKVCDADVLIALGDGIHDRSLIDVAESIAGKIGGAVCCSRALVDRGWMPHDRQVGMSGHNVKPRLYVAFGISGAVQHIVGMVDSEVIISVNNDPEAPIHKYADLSLIADCGAVLRALDSAL